MATLPADEYLNIVSDAAIPADPQSAGHLLAGYLDRRLAV